MNENGAGPAFRTPQEAFWAGAFGDAYRTRNVGDALVRSNEVLFRRILAAAGPLESVVELGCNIGLNLLALRRLDPDLRLTAYEINAGAVEEARRLGVAKVEHGTILDPIEDADTYDLSFTKGVLIHIQPDCLPAAYDNLVRLSRRYVLVCEYYNPTPVAVTYRGHEDRLFKRDFAGDLMDAYGLKLVDYGFVYRRDPVAPQDDATWFLLSK